MYCPKCSTSLCFCDICKSMNNSIARNQNAELFICKGCHFTRPNNWWEALELDINTEIEWAEEVVDEEEMPEELTGYCENPWSD